MTRRLVVLIGVLIAVWCSVALGAEKLLVDKILATIETEPISALDVEVEDSILKVAKDSMLYPGQEANLTTEQVFNELFVRNLLYRQVIKLGLDKISDDRLVEIMKEFQNKVGSEKAYIQFLLQIEMKDERLDEQMKGNVEWQNFQSIARRFKQIALVKELVDKKIAMQVRLSLDVKWQEEEGRLRSEHPGMSDEELKKTLQTALFQERLSDYIRDVKNRTRVLILEPNLAENLPK